LSASLSDWGHFGGQRAFIWQLNKETFTMLPLLFYFRTLLMISNNRFQCENVFIPAHTVFNGYFECPETQANETFLSRTIVILPLSTVFDEYEPSVFLNHTFAFLCNNNKTLLVYRHERILYRRLVPACQQPLCTMLLGRKNVVPPTWPTLLFVPTANFVLVLFDDFRANIWFSVLENMFPALTYLF